MADEEKKDYSESKSIFARAAEGAIDGFAKSNPVIGGALQAMVGTQDYKDRVDARNYDREQREHGRKQMAFEQKKMDEYDKNAPVRAAQSESAMKKAMYEGQLAEEGMGATAQEQRETGRQAQIAENKLAIDKARLGQQYVWQQGKDNYMGNVSQNLIKYYANDPNCNMSIPEITGMINSPAVQQAIEGQYYLERMLRIGDGDTDALNEIDAELNQNGWDAEFDKNGVLYLKMGNANPIPVTKESVHMLGQYVEQNKRDEMSSRDAVSLKNSLGSADKMLNRKFIMDAANKFTGGSYSQAQKYVEGFTSKATPEQAAWARLHQAYDDLGDPSLSITAKMDELASCAQSLEDMGYAIQGINPKDPMSIMGASILDNASGRTMTLQQFGDLCKQNDTMSRDIENGINENALRVASANVKQAAQNVKDTGKAVDGEEQSEEDKKTAARYKELEANAKSLWGHDFAAMDDEEQAKAVQLLDAFELGVKDKLNSLGFKNPKDIGMWGIKDLETLEDMFRNDLRQFGLPETLKFPMWEELEQAKKMKSAQGERVKKRDEQKRKEEAEKLNATPLPSGYNYDVLQYKGPIR